MRLLSAVAVLGSLSLLPCSLSGKELGDPGGIFGGRGSLR
jgi:hypothetical protein